MAILHRIKAWLYKNPLTSDQDDYIIKVHSERTLNIEEICEAAVSRGGADISAPAMKHAVDVFLKEMVYQLCDGYFINTGWFTAGLTVKGVAHSPLAQFDKEIHTALFEFHQGALSRKELENVLVEILGVADTGAIIEQVLDVKTGSINDLITPNRNIRIAGDKIKIAGDNVDNGIYFVNQVTAERTKVDSSDIVTNNPSELIIVVPVLAAGTYLVEVTTQYSNGSTLLKQPRSAIFDRILTVT
jgi:hypothetical protein